MSHDDLEEIQSRSAEIGEAAIRSTDKGPSIAINALARAVAAFAVALDRSGLMREDEAIALMTRGAFDKAAEFNAAFRSKGEA